MTDACVDEVPLYLAQAYSDVATDVLILALPIPLSKWHVQLRLDIPGTDQTSLGTAFTYKPQDSLDRGILPWSLVSNVFLFFYGYWCLRFQEPLLQA